MAGKGKDKKKTKNPGNVRRYTGILDVSKSGMGFVAVEGMEKDIIIKKGGLGNAMHGDTVQVESKGYADNNKRVEGYIVNVVTRKQSDFTGRVEVHPHFAFLLPDNKNIPTDIYIPLHLLHDAKNGDYATARIVEWTEKNKNPIGEIINILNDMSVNDIAMQNILSESGFPLTFPDDVMEESARIPEIITEEDLKDRADYRTTTTFTIDPADAKDFDDALSFKVLKGGWYEVGVHIADVSHYLLNGTAMDDEAYKRATSVYLPDRVLPMLPEKISNELCSLRPHEEKLTFSVVVKINKKGNVAASRIEKTVIHSDHRFSYEEVQTILETGDGPYVKELVVLNEMAQRLRAERFAKGAINFSSQEVRFKLDETGKPIGIVVKESKDAHKLIEEFMLLANRTVAELVSSRDGDEPLPFPYRVHDVPNDEKLKVFTMFAGRFGVKFDLSTPEAVAKSFNEMLEYVHGKPEQHVLEQLGIRTMSKAVYTTDNIGHYGLGFDHYCHFTSPIRRYPDVMVHRILFDLLQNRAVPDKHLESRCRHCSDQERKAMEAERTANKYKQVEFMRDYIGDEFEGVISGVSPYGFWVETVETKCEGMVPASDLYDVDTFTYSEGEYALIGLRTGLRFSMGDKLTVKLAAANLEKRQIDFSVSYLPSSVGHAGKKAKSGGAKKKKGRNWEDF